MHKLLSSRNVSNDSINKNHHQHHYHNQQQKQQNIPFEETQLQSQPQKLQQQNQQQLQQQQQQQQHHQRNNHLNITKIKEVNNYEKFNGCGTIKSISDIQPSKVKMSGYLKKKRTKVGGWRKMWFVLQNQLLLSYSSKENYDKKLVSFKDVLNLVPGTTIHPLGSFRFAIETTTNVMYNFRCDDSQSYNQWLNALVESLSLNLQQQRSSKDSRDNSKHHKVKNSISLDNIQRTTPPIKNPIKNCNSSDSISRFNLSQMPNIPIADATAKILQRNGIPSTGNGNDNKGQKDDRHRNSINSNSTNSRSVISTYSDGSRNNNRHEQLEASSDKQERARNFRLHEKRLSSGMLQQNLHQSDEVSRINRMFSRSRSANNVTNPSVIFLEHDNKNSTAATITKTNSTLSSSSPYSSIVNIIGNPIIGNKIKSSSSSTTSSASVTATASSGITSVGIASIISLKEGYGRYNENNKNQRKNLINVHSDDYMNYYGKDLNNFINHRLIDHKLNNGKQKLLEKQLNQSTHRESSSANGVNRHSGRGSKKFLDIDRRSSNQFFPVKMATTRNNDIFDNEADIIDGRHSSTSGSNNSSKSSSPMKYKVEKENSDNNSSSIVKSNNCNNCTINNGNKGSELNQNLNITNTTTMNSCSSELRDLNQNRLFHHLNYEKIDFQQDKDGDDSYECYPLQEKMKNLNICKHQQQKENGSEITSKLDQKITKQYSENLISPIKKSISLERGGQHPFYTETDFPLFPKSQLNTLSSPHQSLQTFHRINSPGKDDFSLSSSSTTTSNSRCNSSLVTTESNSPINDGSTSLQHLQYQQQQQRQLSKVLDSRIHPALQPSESMEDDLHMMNILIRNDGDGESNTEDILDNIIEEQRSFSAQCTSAEPIYALVDLKNKHARRAKLRELQDQLAVLTEARDRERPRSLQCISSGDYEEVLNFECMQDENDAEEEDEDDDENENIYEPINIPEYAHHRQQQNNRHALWKYFRRINIESILDLARNKKIRSPRHNQNISKFDPTTLHPTMSLPPDAYNHHHHETSPFSDIRRKLGNHRKSIKLRMKRFYNRNDVHITKNSHTNAIIKERNAFSDDELDSQGATGSTGSGASENSLKSSDGTTGTGGSDEKRSSSSSSFVFGEFDKYRRSQKQFFGSLTRLKKTRTSISLEEDDVKNFNNNISNFNKPWLISPKINRSEEKISMSNKYSKKKEEITSNTSQII